MDLLCKLNTETDYDLMSTNLTNNEGVAGIATIFPGYNTRVLLTAFMFKNFRDVFDIPDPLFEKSNYITELLMGVQHEKLHAAYPAYFDLFKLWRESDISKLKETIKTHHTIYGKMLDEEEDIKNDADQQWHDGVTSSIATMEKHIEVLDEYSKTPPTQY